MVKGTSKTKGSSGGSRKDFSRGSSGLSASGGGPGSVDDCLGSDDGGSTGGGSVSDPSLGISQSDASVKIPSSNSLSSQEVPPSAAGGQPTGANSAKDAVATKTAVSSTAASGGLVNNSGPASTTPSPQVPSVTSSVAKPSKSQSSNSAAPK